MMQVDVSKRKAIQTLSVAAAAVAAPTAAFSAVQSLSDSTIGLSKVTKADSIIVTLIDDNSAKEGYSFVATNDSAYPKTLRHVHPGIVSTPQRSFNINESLPKNGVVLAPGKTIKFAALPADSLIPEHTVAPMGAELSSIKVITANSSTGTARSVITSRTMFS